MTDLDGKKVAVTPNFETMYPLRTIEVTVHRLDSNPAVAALVVAISVRRDNLTAVDVISGYSTVIESCMEYAVLTAGMTYTAEFTWNETAPKIFDPVTDKYITGGDGLPGPTGYQMSGAVYVISGFAYDEDNLNNVVVDGTVSVLVLVGDIDNNQKVDIRDIGAAAKAFGSYPGHDRWNHEADIDGNDKINIIDIFRIAKNFGKTLESLAAD